VPSATQSDEDTEYLYLKYLRDGGNLKKEFSTSEREPNKNL
jgi:hypothetical protein